MSLQTAIDNGHARRAGGVENYFCILQRQNIYRNFIVVARFNKPVNDERRLSYALRSLLTSYPILASSMVTTDYSDLSVPRPVHDFIKVMQTVTLDDMLLALPQEILDCEDPVKQLSLLSKVVWKYADETPMWKVAYLDEYTLVYISNHVMSDGQTAKSLISRIQSLYNEVPERYEQDEYLLQYESDYKILPKLPPPIDTVVSYTPPLSFLPGYFVNRAIVGNLCFSKTIASRDDTHSYRIIHIDSVTLKSLLKNLKAHGSTLTPYIVTAVLNAMYQVVLQSSWLKLMDVVIPCDSRQFIPGGPRDELTFGANTAGSHFWYPPIKQHSWSNVSYTQKFFNYCKNSQSYLYGLGILITDFISRRSNLDKLIEGATVNTKRSGVNFSNIGVIQQSEGEYEIEDVIFSKNSQGTINSFSMSACTAKSGMNLVLTMVDGTITSEQFDKVGTILEANIISMA